MENTVVTCNQANQLDLVDYLQSLGFAPQKIRGNDYWYVSPFREEKTASFKVNRKLNAWYDHGDGRGGKLVDFGILYFNCTVTELLKKISMASPVIFPLHPPKPAIAAEKKQGAEEGAKIQIISSREIADPGLRHYLSTRQIPLPVANQFCDEVVFELYGKKHLAIGFKNELGGYELRNAYFKGSSTPKRPRLISPREQKELAVFEGFFSFLSFQTIVQSGTKIPVELPQIQANYLVLNSLSFFDRSRELMERYEAVHLFLDRDKGGVLKTREALERSSKYKDQSKAYATFKDLNECLVNTLKTQLQQQRRRGRPL